MGLITTKSLWRSFWCLSLLLALVCLAAPLNTNVAAQSKGKLCSGANLDLGGSQTSCDKSAAGNVCHEYRGGPAVPCSDKSLNNLVRQVVNIFSIIVGVVAVIMMIYGGFRYITSGGDSTKVGEAKHTVIYAIVGLIIVALSQVIVKFVLSKAV